MARIYGTIESLKALKQTLHSYGIIRFSSVKEINQFLVNYYKEEQDIIKTESTNLEKKYDETTSNHKQNLQKRTNQINLFTERINLQITHLQSKIEIIKRKRTNFILKIVSKVKLHFLKYQYNSLNKNKTKQINSSIISLNKQIKEQEAFIKKYEADKQTLIYDNAKSKLDELKFTYKIVQKCKNIISGAVGENLVVNEIKKLSDDYVLINDFNLRLSSPIYYRKYNQRIYSIQIDHLLISKAGIFIIETKNWSPSSVNSNNLRSPIEQIERANFALYVYLTKNISILGHHWGEQQIPIRNLIVMIQYKPKEDFKYVKVKKLSELNNYINYFEPVFTDMQFNKIVKLLS